MVGLCVGSSGAGAYSVGCRWGVAGFMFATGLQFMLNNTIAIRAKGMVIRCGLTGLHVQHSQNHGETRVIKKIG